MKRFVEWYLGVAPAKAGEGTAWNFGYQSPWPAWMPNWVVLLLALAVVAYVVVVYRRDAETAPVGVRLTFAALRLTAVGLILIFLSEVTLSIDRIGLPSVILAIDVSASMGLDDRYQDSDAARVVAELADEDQSDSTQRLNLVKSLLTRRNGRWLQEVADRQTLHVYRFSESAAPVGHAEYRLDEELAQLRPLLSGLEAEGVQTRPGPSLRKILDDFRGRPPSAIVVFTDGITTTTDSERLSAVADLAVSQLVPLFPVVVGSEEPARDLNLYDMRADEVAFVNDPITFNAKLRAFGYGGQNISITLREKHSGDVLQRQRIAAPADGRPTDVSLTHMVATQGEYDFVLEAEPQPNETDVENNAETKHVSVREDKVRVLLADSLPRYEFRYLKHLLEREKTVELHTVLQDADVEYAREDATALEHFPVRREELLEYDVIILGDVNPDFLSAGAFETLQEFVRDTGGGLLMIAGPQFNPVAYRGTPLEVLVPVQLAGMTLPAEAEPTALGFRPRLTLEGRKGNPLFRFGETEQESLEIWRRLPELIWHVDAPEVKPGARVLAEHPTRSGAEGRLPVIAMQQYGSGKVLFHATDELWRWRFRTGDMHYGRYWIQAVRFLSRSKLLGQDRGAELSSVRSIYQRGDVVELRLRFLDERLAPAEDDGVKVIVERRGGSQQPVTLTRLPSAPMVFEGRVGRLRDGAYHALVMSPTFSEAPPTAEFRVEAPRKELARRSVDRVDLQKAATATRGRLFTLADVEQLPRALPPGRPVPLESHDPRPLWNRWELLLLFTAVILGEWLLRKKYRLI